MQKAGSLIKQLVEQYEAKANAETLSHTAQMLLNELRQAPVAANIVPKKVAVIMPAARYTAVETAPVNIPPEEILIIEKEKPVAVAEIIEMPEPEPVKKEYAIRPPASSNIHLIDELPTFAYQQKEVFELNDAIAEHKESLNERLKENRPELGNMLKEAPVRDLRKAIGINDRFVFINEMFRGDEDMYERSIKTINSFNIFPEAEFWIKRELKLKQAWDESSAVVQLFDQLVRRRFS